MEFDKVIKERTSCRTYLPDEITDEQIEQIVGAARLAPSSKNAQQWKFVCVKTGSNSKDIANMLKNYYLQNKDDPEKMDGASSIYSTGKILEDCPAIIFVFEDSRNIDRDKVRDISALLGIGAAVEHMALKATDMGLGNLWIADTYFVRDQIADYIISSLSGTNKQDFINLENRLICALAIGKSGEPHYTRPRKDLDQILAIVNK